VFLPGLRQKFSIQKVHYETAPFLWALFDKTIGMKLLKERAAAGKPSRMVSD
jgi:hypothetical protein